MKSPFLKLPKVSVYRRGTVTKSLGDNQPIENLVGFVLNKNQVAYLFPLNNEKLLIVLIDGIELVVDGIKNVDEFVSINFLGGSYQIKEEDVDSIFES